MLATTTAALFVDLLMEMYCILCGLRLAIIRGYRREKNVCVSIRTLSNGNVRFSDPKARVGEEKNSEYPRARQSNSRALARIGRTLGDPASHSSTRTVGDHEKMDN